MYIYSHDFSDAQAESEGQNISKLRYRRYRPASIQVIDKKWGRSEYPAATQSAT